MYQLCLSLDVFLISLAVIAAIYLSRFIILKPLLKGSIMPELALAPRGLLTILLSIYHSCPLGCS